MVSKNRKAHAKNLGISEDAPTRVIRRAFRKLALIRHPDKKDGSKEAHRDFQGLLESYQALLKDAPKGNAFAQPSKKSTDEAPKMGENGAADSDLFRKNFHRNSQAKIPPSEMTIARFLSRPIYIIVGSAFALLVVIWGASALRTQYPIRSPASSVPIITERSENLSSAVADHESIRSTAIQIPTHATSEKPKTNPESLRLAVQGAANAAAFAGAKVRATQLSYAAALNWEIRRALKEFLFAYTVRIVGTALPCFPQNPSGLAGPSICPKLASSNDRYNFAIFDPRETMNQQGGPFLPSICFVQDSDDNLCQKMGQPRIPEFDDAIHKFSQDPIVVAVRSATNRIIEKKIAKCLTQKDINQKVMGEILFGTDTALAKYDIFPGRQGLDRLGVLTRIALLSSRLDILRSWLSLNLAKTQGGNRTVGSDDLAALATNRAFERPKRAFEAAREYLQREGLSEATLELTEKMDPSFFLDDTAPVSIATSIFNTPGKLNRGACFQQRESGTIPRFPFGIRAGPDIQLPYSISIQVKFADATIKSTSTANPTFVRIGPYMKPGPEGDQYGRTAVTIAAEED